MLRAYLFIVCCMLLTSTAYSQRSSAFTVEGTGCPTAFVTDYQSIGINPANLGWYTEKNVHLGLLETGAYLNSTAFQRRNVFEVIKGDSKLTQAEKRQAAQDFANSGTTVNVDVTLLGLSIQFPKIGTFATAIKLKSSNYALINSTASDILFNGYRADYFDSLAVAGRDTTGYRRVPQPISEITDGTHIQSLNYAEFNLAYGRMLFASSLTRVFGGVNLKYLYGLGVSNLQSENGVLDAYAAITPGLGNLEFNLTSSEGIDSTQYQAVGTGLGFDLGLSAEWNEKLYFSFAINDIGSMNWNTNVLQLRDDAIEQVESDGVSGYNFLTENAFEDDDLFYWQPSVSRNIKLPTRVQGGIRYMVTDALGVATHITLPMNESPGNLQQTLVAVGGQYAIAKLLYLSAGLTYGSIQRFGLATGVYVDTRAGYAFGVSTGDILSFATQKNPYVSAAVGVARLKF